eukprot:249617_1
MPAWHQFVTQNSAGPTLASSSSLVSFILFLSSFVASHSHGASKRFNITYDEWILQEDPLIPTVEGKNSAGAAIGYSSLYHKIYLIGGGVSQRLLEYDIANNVFMNHGNYLLAESVNGFSQYFTQIDRYLYMLHGDTQSFARFDVNTKRIEYNLHRIPRPITINGPCLVSVHDDTHEKEYLIVLGQGKPAYSESLPVSRTVQVLNLTSNAWLSTHIPSMNANRSEFACIVYDHSKLYAIGGHGGYDTNGRAIQLNSVEVLDVSDIHAISTKSWRILPDKLTHSMYTTRAMIYHTDVLIIGGIMATTYLSDINVIDTVSDTIRVKGALPENQFFGHAEPCIIVNYTAYVFSSTSGRIWRMTLPNPSNFSSIETTESNRLSTETTTTPVDVSQHMHVTTVLAIDTSGSNEGAGTGKSTGDANVVIWVLITVIAVVVVAFAVFCFVRYNKKKKTKQEVSEHDHLRSMYHVPDVISDAAPAYLPQATVSNGSYGCHDSSPRKPVTYTQSVDDNTPHHITPMAVQTFKQENTIYGSDSDSDTESVPPPPDPPTEAQPPPPPSSPPPVDDGGSSSDDSVYLKQREFLEAEIKERESLHQDDALHM